MLPTKLNKSPGLSPTVERGRKVSHAENTSELTVSSCQERAAELCQTTREIHKCGHLWGLRVPQVCQDQCCQVLQFIESRLQILPGL